MTELSPDIQDTLNQIEATEYDEPNAPTIVRAHPARLKGTDVQGIIVSPISNTIILDTPHGRIRCWLHDLAPLN